MAHEEEQRLRERSASTASPCATIIAAVRLARDENIGVPSPRVLVTTSDSVALARNIVRIVGSCTRKSG